MGDKWIIFVTNNATGKSFMMDGYGFLDSKEEAQKICETLNQMLLAMNSDYTNEVYKLTKE